MTGTTSRGKRIFVIGELNVDFILSGEEVLPEWNREKLVEEFDMVLGSSSAITACGLAGLGHEVSFVSKVGNDAFGEFCINKLKNAGIDTKWIKRDTEEKTGVTISLSTAKDRALLTYMGTIPSLSPKDLPKSLLSEAEHVHFGSYYLQEGMKSHWISLFRDLQKNQIHTSFDTGWDPKENWNYEQIQPLLKYTDLFIRSQDEFEHIFGVLEKERLLAQLPEERGFIAVKCGSKGSCIISGNEMEWVSGYKVQSIDTTGAGDSFNAGLISEYLNGCRGRNLARYANACGALATLRVGGAEEVPTKKAVEVFMKNNRSD